MKKFDEFCKQIILEETTNFNKTKIKSMIKKVLTENYRNVKTIKDGYSFENLIVKPAIIKGNPTHNSFSNQFQITFNIEDNKVNLTCSYQDKTKEKSIKITDKIEDLQDKIEKFITSSVSSFK